MSSVWLYPDGVGDLTGIADQTPESGEHWDKVDDPSPDGATTTVHTASLTEERDLYTIGSPSSDNTGEISNLTLRLVIGGGTVSGGVCWPLIKTHGTIYLAASGLLVGTTWQGFTRTFGATNPYTGAQWTWNEIIALQIGYDLKGYAYTDAYGNPQVSTSYVTRILADVTYSFKTPGHIWVEGTKLHRIDEQGQEKRILGADTTVNANPGHLFVEGNYLHYVDANGDERRQLGKDTGVDGTVPGQTYIDDLWYYYLDASNNVRKMGTWMLGSSTLGVDTILHA